MPFHFSPGNLFALFRHGAFSYVWLSLAGFWPLLAAAGPWVDPGDERVKHHLNALSDATPTHVLVTTWPISWSNIKAALEDLDPTTLDPQSLWSYRYLLHEIRKNSRESITRQSIHLSSAPTGLSYFGSDYREELQATGSIDWVGEKFAVNIQGTYAHDPLDGRDSRADGSYISYLAGNWAVGFGLIDRWWGPGWESSLILSSNARPVPALFLQRHTATAFETPWLSWLGPWQLTTFMGQLEEYRHVSDARLWGMRLNFKPLPHLEIGLSRTAQWGGDGRPGDLNTFFKLLVGKDNRGDDLAVEDEPGNQLAGMDVRWGFSLGSYKNAMYAQLIGEDEAGGLPSRHIGMAGVETSTLLWQTQFRFSFEAQNSTVYFYDDREARGEDPSRPNYNSAYEHAIYQSGYRYLGRPLGASSDNDSEILTARVQAYFENGHHLTASFAHNRINTDGTNTGRSAGGNVFGADGTTTDTATFEYNIPVSDSLLLQLGLFYYSEPLILADEEIDSGGFIGLQGYW